MTNIYKDRIEEGVKYRWVPTSRLWRSEGGKRVIQVIPPGEKYPEWTIKIPHAKSFEIRATRNMTDEDLMKAVFTMANNFVMAEKLPF